jgi:hypothetical protein
MNNKDMIFQWDKTLTDYLKYLKSNISFDTKDNLSISQEIASFLAEIIKKYISGIKSKDTWAPITWRSTSHGIEVHAYSNIQNHKYSLGLYQNEIYFQSTILEPQNLKNMPDEFWEIFTELTKLENFKFQENAGLPDTMNASTILKGCRSNTYKLIRNFVLLEEHSQYGSSDLGCLELSWDITESFDNILSVGTEAMKKIHKLNYLLYRCEYQKSHSKSK